jgi:hypothetical protein
MRAPEVWAGYGCRHVSDVYSVGSTIISWLQPGVLGSQDVKIIKLVETENIQTVDPPADFASNIKSMYELGRVLLTQPEEDDNGSMHVPARPLREVLCRLGTTPELKLSSKFCTKLPEPLTSGVGAHVERVRSTSARCTEKIEHARKRSTSLG